MKHCLTPNFWERLPIFLGIKIKALDLQISERMCRDVLKFVANNNYSNQCEESGRWKSTRINWSSFNSADLIETQTRIWSRVNKTWIFLRFCPRCSDKSISKMKMGLENVVVYITEMTKAFIMFLSSEQARWSCVLIGFLRVSEQDGPLLVPRDLPRWLLKTSTQNSSFRPYKKNLLYRPNFFDQDSWIMASFFFAFLCLPLGFWIIKKWQLSPSMTSRLVNNVAWCYASERRS